MYRNACNVCSGRTNVPGGWHLKHNINLCSNPCVATWIEKQEKFIMKLQGQK